MTEYICISCNENCVHEDYDLEDMGILIGEEICNVVCPYSGYHTEFVRCDKEGKNDPIRFSNHTPRGRRTDKET